MIDFRKEPSRRPRRSRTPLAQLHPTERVRGSNILEEHDWPLAQVLWESYRNVGDWALTPKEQRTRHTIPPGALERRNEQLAAEWMEPEVRAELEIVRDMMAEPCRTPERLVARACRRISAWAGERGALATQFYFAAAAGLCLPEDARQAYRVGCLARSLAKWDAAEVWLEHAIAAARRKRDRETQGMAILGLGNTYYRQGLYTRAKEAYATGFTLASKHQLPEIEGGALHDLFAVSVETEEYTQAEEYARLALRAYGRDNPRVPGLAHDVAYFWLVRGHAARALRVLEALLPRLVVAAHRMLALAVMGRAGGSCGRRDVFERAWRGVWALRSDPEVRSRIAPALMELAHGAASLGDIARAEKAGGAAIEVARARGEWDVAERVEALIGQLTPDPALRAQGITEGCSGTADQLADELVEALTAGAGTE